MHHKKWTFCLAFCSIGIWNQFCRDKLSSALLYFVVWCNALYCWHWLWPTSFRSNWVADIGVPSTPQSTLFKTRHYLVCSLHFKGCGWSQCCRGLRQKHSMMMTTASIFRFFFGLASLWAYLAAGSLDAIFFSHPAWITFTNTPFRPKPKFDKK